MKRRTFVLGGLAAGGLGASAGAVAESFDTPKVPDLTLLDHLGRPVPLRSLLARHTVAVNFIFTGCANFCPPQTAVFRAVQMRLPELRALQPAPLLLSLSLDPLSDSPQALVRYAQRFEAKLGLEQGWLMLTGEVAAMGQAALAFDAGGPNLDDHPARLWVGSKSRWLSATGLAGPDVVLRMMKKVAA
ncbi:MAG: SCO family protein [Burkholderiaceae bacterium]